MKMGVLKYTESENNEADMMTKNVVCVLQIRHGKRNGAIFCYVYWDDVIIKDWRDGVKI